jgi:3-isopropylmalate/(R)-2-methylmalate dehydratase small subunit
MATFTKLTSRVLPLLVDNIDTDQIIPARFLKVTDKKGLGNNLFSDWRYLPDGSPNPDFILNKPQASGVQILLAGDNFGCGSSREHAPWALTGFGFRAVISTSFADIFKSNALKNGLLPIVVEPKVYQQLCSLAGINGALQLTIDLMSQTVSLPGGTKFTFPIDEFSKKCLLNGVDELGYILQFKEAIMEYEKTHDGD